MSDAWAGTSTGIAGPARNAAAVTPNDSTDLPVFARALTATTSGAVVVDMVGSGSSITLQLDAGAILPLCVKRVRSTGTTATGIVALW